MNKWKLARNGYLFLAVIFYILGFIYIFLPDIPAPVLCGISGIVLISYGVIKMLGYFSQDLYCLAFQNDFACGLLLLTLGVIVLACHTYIIPYLSPGLGLLVLLDSVFTIQMSMDARRFGLETWSLILFVSVVAGVFGTVLMIRPYHTQQAAHFVAGCTLLAEGTKNHCVILNAAKSKNMAPSSRSDG